MLHWRLFSALLQNEPTPAGPLRHFFLGDTNDTLSRLKAHVEQTYPTAVVAGTFSPPFQSEPEALSADEAAEIDSTEADILWVGLGTPKQDLWIARNRHHLTIPVAIGIGAAFRFELGILERAPGWVGETGFEWAFRLWKEPRKMWRRSVLGGSSYLGWSLMAAARRRVRFVSAGPGARR